MSGLALSEEQGSERVSCFRTTEERRPRERCQAVLMTSRGLGQRPDDRGMNQCVRCASHTQWSPQSGSLKTRSTTENPLSARRRVYSSGARLEWYSVSP